VKTVSNKRGMLEVEVLCIPRVGDEIEASSSMVVEEDALTLDVEGVGHYTLMYTPTVANGGAQGFTPQDGLLGGGEHPESLSLAMGFAFSEGLIKQLADVRSLSLCPDNPQQVRVQLHHPEKVGVTRRNVVIDSSCGICGPREILQDNVLGLERLPSNLQLAGAHFSRLMDEMQERQAIFQQTGGSHAAAIFNPRGEIIAVAEDLGRHNALDKAIGMVLLDGGSVAGCGVLLSSRLSLEMVLKAVRTGLEIMLAVSAPTSLAIDVADRFGVTLCGFVRDDRATIYTHPQRIC